MATKLRTIHKFRCFCKTESKYTYVWSETTPTFCPNNIAHELDVSSLTIVDSVSDKKMNIPQDFGLTGGNFRSETIDVVVKPHCTETFNFSWPFDIALHTARFVTNSQHVGDYITSVISPNTTIGVTTQSVQQGDTTIHVSPTVIQNSKKGYLVSLTNGVLNCNIGTIDSIDAALGTITCQIPSSYNFDMSTVTYVILEIRNINNFRIGDPACYEIGTHLIQAGIIPQGTIVQLRYENKSLTDAKMFSFYYEYFY